MFIFVANDFGFMSKNSWINLRRSTHKTIMFFDILMEFIFLQCFSTSIFANPFLGCRNSNWMGKSSFGISKDLILLIQHHCLTSTGARRPLVNMWRFSLVTVSMTCVLKLLYLLCFLFIILLYHILTWQSTSMETIENVTYQFFIKLLLQKNFLYFEDPKINFQQKEQPLPICSLSYY